MHSKELAALLEVAGEGWAIVKIKPVRSTVTASGHFYLRNRSSVHGMDEMIQIAGFWIGERLYKQFLAAVDESK